ncbi:cellulase family glycosylhydrolase [Klebsiella grimontii]|uniref:hypothetical protein n=1 Tax=Klebsiella grimontii TaxID=2058152 RepID=UPI0012B93532|nr:hypothetical protein [Klebsiella grimontii]MBZ7341432.1 hypothetical protein [Klebsiella grimontii]MBZ7566178.1 hypothetical protein [Klebsiella grimontii]MDU2467166.1 hypothetical protein [Veillonella sp.]QXW41209.1 hypothetical protein KXJ78_08725 [Klebsiella grimontii]
MSRLFICFKAYVFFYFILLPISSWAYILGIGGHPEGFTGTPEQYINLLKRYNISSLRTDYLWREVEITKGSYNPANIKTESVLNISFNQGVSALLILGYGNNLYSAGKPQTKDQIIAYSNYAAWTAEHFKGRGYIYEIWNEWPHRDNKDSSPVNIDSALNYIELVKSASLAIKKVDPNAKVIAGGFNPIDGLEKKWGLYLVRNGILKYVDGLSIHPYAYSSRRLASPATNLSIVKNFHNMLISNNKGFKEIPLYVTEIGYPTYRGNPQFTEDDVESYAAEYLKIADTMPFVKGVWWYDLKDDGNDKYNKEHNFGILKNNLAEKKVADVFTKSKLYLK